MYVDGWQCRNTICTIYMLMGGGVVTRHTICMSTTGRVVTPYKICMLTGDCVAIPYTICPEASVVHASGSGLLQANPHMAGPWLSPGTSTRRAVTTMGSNDMVVGEDHMLGQSCQRYNWQTGRCGSIAFGSSPS